MRLLAYMQTDARTCMHARRNPHLPHPHMRAHAHINIHARIKTRTHIRTNMHWEFVRVGAPITYSHSRQGWVQIHIFNQIQMQLGQIKFKYKYIPFLDFNSNANTTTSQFKYKYTAILYSNILPFFKVDLNMIQILARVSIIVQVYHSG